MLNLKCLSNKITWTYSTVWRKKVMRMLSDSLPFLLGFILIWKIQSSIEESNVQRNLNCVCFTNLTKMALINNYNDIKIVEWNKIKRERERAEMWILWISQPPGFLLVTKRDCENTLAKVYLNALSIVVIIAFMHWKKRKNALFLDISSAKQGKK